MPDDLKLRETDNLDRIHEMAGDHEHLNRPTAHASKKTHYLALHEDKEIGTGWIRTIGSIIGVVGGMYIEKKYRNQGLGEKLFDALCGQLKQRNCRIIVLGVHRGNKPAVSLYRKKGFRTVIPWIPGFTSNSGIIETIESVLTIPLPPQTTKIMIKVI